MSEEIPQGLIDRLLEVARSERFSELEDIGESLPHAMSGSFMRLRPNAWHQVADALSEDELVLLISRRTADSGPDWPNHWMTRVSRSPASRRFSVGSRPAWRANA